MYIVKVIEEGLKYKDLINILENKRKEILYIELDNEEYKPFVEVSIYYKNNTYKEISISNSYTNEVLNKIEFYFNNYSKSKEFKVFLNKDNFHKIIFIQERDCDEYNIYYDGLKYQACISGLGNELINNILKNKIKIDEYENLHVYFKDISDIKLLEFETDNLFIDCYTSLFCYKIYQIEFLHKNQHIKIKKQIELINNIKKF